MPAMVGKCRDGAGMRRGTVKLLTTSRSSGPITEVHAEKIDAAIKERTLLSGTSVDDAYLPPNHRTTRWDQTSSEARRVSRVPGESEVHRRYLSIVPGVLRAQRASHASRFQPILICHWHATASTALTYRTKNVGGMGKHLGEPQQPNKEPSDAMMIRPQRFSIPFDSTAV